MTTVKQNRLCQLTLPVEIWGMIVEEYLRLDPGLHILAMDYRRAVRWLDNSGLVGMSAKVALGAMWHVNDFWTESDPKLAFWTEARSFQSRFHELNRRFWKLALGTTALALVNAYFWGKVQGVRRDVIRDAELRINQHSTIHCLDPCFINSYTSYRGFMSQQERLREGKSTIIRNALEIERHGPALVHLDPFHVTSTDPAPTCS